MRSLVFLLSVGLGRMAFAAESCPPLKIEGLKQQLAAKPASELIFFASWCLSCKKHLETLEAEKIYIASFDERAAANKIFEHFRGAQTAAPRCFWDEDGSISAFYEVKGLPAHRSLSSPGAQEAQDKR